jgi:HAD superfamily hydrolase (TIGR01509 family)
VTAPVQAVVFDLDGVLSPEALRRQVVDALRAAYADPPPAAVEAVRRLRARWPLAVASSSNKELIEVVLDELGIADAFSAVVSSEEVDRGKPAPDVYLEACRRLGLPASACVAVEDSTNGLFSAHAAGMAVIAVPNAEYPPAAAALAVAGAVVADVAHLTAETVLAASSGGRRAVP